MDESAPSVIELERTIATLEATTQIARAVGDQTDLDVILELVAKRGRALVSARGLVIELLDGDELVIAAEAGDLPLDLVDKRIALARTVASAALTSRRTQRIEVDANRARFDQHGLGSLGIDASAGLVVPLVFQARAHGVLLALDRLEDGPDFSREDERLLEAFAVSAAIAVATAQSVADEHHRQRLAAAEAERGRWARELHDETLQGLAALRVGLSVARRSGRPEVLSEAVDGALRQLEIEIANLRALITDLRPAALDELGTEAAVKAIVARAETGGLAVDLTIDLASAADPHTSRHIPELETAVYRIVQEALTNALKHGRATSAVIAVREADDQVHVLVRDDGCGFRSKAETEGFGILGMRERAELQHGRLEISSAPGEGTSVTASMPVRRRS
jgi:signal transduction histidine kinase